jgi:hypothetical protein
MEMEAVVVAAAALCGALALYLYHALWVAPERVRAALRAQGVAGPRPSFPYGNRADMRRAAAAAAAVAPAAGTTQRGGIVHDYRQALFPHYERWRKEYGTYAIADACIHVRSSVHVCWLLRSLGLRASVSLCWCCGAVKG